jgi:hypothetical protein
MKNFILTVFVFFLSLGVLFAADNYTVESVSGRVERQVSPYKWAGITAGDILSAGTVVDVGLNASLVLNDGGEFITITSKQKGTINALLSVAFALGSGVKIMGGDGNSNDSGDEKRSTAD